MRIILFSILFFSFCHFQAQNLHFQEQKQQLEIDSIIQSYQETNKYQFLALAPSVSYDAFNNSINIGFSLNNLSQYFQAKHRNKIELSKLKYQLEAKADQDLQIWQISILNFESSFQAFLIDFSNFNIWIKLFQIQQGKHKNGEITTEDFLRQELIFSNQFKTILTQLEKLLISIISIKDEEIKNNRTQFLQIQKENLLQMGKNFGILRAEPLSFQGME